MKKFILGLACGIALTAATAVYAEDTIRAYLFPVKFEVNGQIKETGSEYTPLNYNGHAYVPVRFIAESLGIGIKYVYRDNLISIMNEPADVDEAAKKVWLTQYRITNGVSENYVKGLLGEPTVERTDDDFQQAVWRYDVSPIQGYQYNNLEKIDIKGLEQGAIKAQIFILWSKEGTVERTVCYSTDKDKWIHVYFLYEDGSSTDALYE